MNLVGHHPGWDYDLTDPLVVDAPIDYVLSELEDRRTDENGDGDRFLIDLAPDFWYKADVSGGAPTRSQYPTAASTGCCSTSPTRRRS